MAKTKVDVLTNGLFVTLTYPRVWPNDNQVWKAHLRAFQKRVQRLHPYKLVPIIWRLEAQRRGAPHFHLIILGIQYLDKDWVAEAWYEIVGSGEEAHRRVGTQVKRVYSARMAAGYVGKYVGKESDGFLLRKCPVTCGMFERLLDGDEIEWTGRWWGVFNKSVWPYGEKHNIYLSNLGTREWMLRFLSLEVGDRFTERLSETPVFGSRNVFLHHDFPLEKLGVEDGGEFNWLDW